MYALRFQDWVSIEKTYLRAWIVMTSTQEKKDVLCLGLGGYDGGAGMKDFVGVVRTLNAGRNGFGLVLGSIQTLA